MPDDVSGHHVRAPRLCRGVQAEHVARFLQDQSFFAVAHMKYVYRDGVEVHRLKSHIEPTRLEFLLYH